MNPEGAWPGPDGAEGLAEGEGAGADVSAELDEGDDSLGDGGLAELADGEGEVVEEGSGELKLPEERSDVVIG